MFVPIGEFAPDNDSTRGNLIDVLNVDPTTTGYKGAPTSTSAGAAALAAACTGGALVRTVENVAVVFAGTGVALYKLGTTTWEDVTRASAYTSTYRWRFAQFGNYTYAVNRTDETQYYLHGTSIDFANQASTPKARTCFSVNGFLFLLGTNEGTYGDQADRWWCSALGDSTDWTPSISTQCATNRLYDTPGPLTAGARLADYAVLFKENALYVGTYAGPPAIWYWVRVSDVYGASSQEAVQNIGQALLFANKDGIFSFDGSTAIPVSMGKISRWYQSKLDASNAHLITSTHNRNAKIVRWYFPVSGGTGTLTAWVSYHYETGKFGYGESTIEAALSYASPAMDYDGFGARYSTYNDLPSVSYDAAIFLSGTEAPAVFNSSHTLCTVDGANSSAMIRTGDIGQDGVISLIKRVRNRYLNNPTSATLTNYYSDQVGSSYTTDVSTTESSGKFDFMRAARWHRLKLETTGNFEIIGADVNMVSAGLE